MIESSAYILFSLSPVSVYFLAMDSLQLSSHSSIPILHVLPLSRRIAYSVGHILNDLCASMWFSYLLIYQQSVLKFSRNIAGRLLLIGQVADAIATPLVGYESDRRGSFSSLSYGRRKTWHLIGTVCVAATFPFLFMQCIQCSNSSQAAQFAYYAAFIVIFQFGWASTQVSHLSLIPDLTPLSSERVELNAMRYAMTVMSNICVYGTMWIVLGVNSSEETHIGPNDSSVFQFVSLSMTGVGLFFSLLFHLFVIEKPIDPPVFDQSLSVSVHSDFNKPHLRWKDWFKQPQFYMVALLYMSTRLYINLSQIYMPIYIEKSLDLHKNNIAIIPLVIYISSFLSSFVVKYLNVNLGNKITYFIGCVLGMAACIWIYFGEGDNFRFCEIYAVAVLIGVAGSTLLIVSLSATSDLISNSITSGAFVFGCMSFVDKLANGVAVIVIQDFHPCFICCADCAKYYEYVLVFACGGALLLGLGALAMLLTQTIGVRRNQSILQGLAAAVEEQRIMTPGTKSDDCQPLLIDDSDNPNSQESDDDDEKCLKAC